MCPCAGGPMLIPDGSGRLGVMIVSDAMTDADAPGGKALVGRDGAMLARALSRYGWKWDDFYCAAAAFCLPSPRLVGQAAASCAAFTAHCRAIKPRVYLTVGRLAFERLTGQRVAPMLARGYVWPALDGAWVVAALPPSYYRQDLGMLPTFLSDAAKAVRIAEQGFAYDDHIVSLAAPDYRTWREFVDGFLADPTRPLAADIETPFKRKADMIEEELASGEDVTYTLDEVNLSYDGVTGVSVPWADPYREGVRQMLAASQAQGVTLFWNAAYDVPRLTANGVATFDPGHTRDVMDTFRVWRNSVRRKLAVATSLLPRCWNVRPWKHLGTSDPFYRAMDVISLWRNDADLLDLLDLEGQRPAYDLFVARLDPELARMTAAGVLTDAARVEALASDVRGWLARMQGAMTGCVPPEVLGSQTWQREAQAQAGLARLKAAAEVLPDAVLEPVPATKRVRACAVCGETGVTKAHVTRKTQVAPTVETVIG